jgi:hypothetical protein
MVHKKDSGTGLIVWVEPGGGCSTAQKVLNMELAGAQAVLLAGFWKEDTFWSMYTDDKQLEKKYSDEAALGYHVRIPAFIMEDSARKIVKEYAEKTMGQWNGAHLVMKADIELPRSHLNTVDYSLWYTSIYDFPAQLILDLYEYQHAFKGMVTFTPRIITFSSTIAPKNLKKKDCLSDGKYCFISPKGNLK